MLNFLRKIRMAIVGFFAGITLLLSVRLFKSREKRGSGSNHLKLPPKPKEGTEDIEKERESIVGSAKEEYEDVKVEIAETEREIESANSNAEIAKMWNDFLNEDKK